MKQKLQLVRILALISVLTFAAPAFLSPVFAEESFEENFDKEFGTGKATAAGKDCPEKDGMRCIAGIAFPDTDLPDTPIEEILLSLMSWLFGIFGLLAIITFLIAGMQYFFAAGKEDAMKTAKKNLIYSIIGIIVAFSGFIIITAIANFLSGYDSF